jgi:hypothetical protein
LPFSKIPSSLTEMLSKLVCQRKGDLCRKK